MPVPGGLLREWVWGLGNPSEFDTRLHDMIVEQAFVKFHKKIDFCCWETISSDIHYNFWFKTFLPDLVMFLRRRALWDHLGSQLNVLLDDELLKALVARRCPNTTTIHTCCSELGISLWDVFWIISLSIVRDMYDEFFLNNNSAMDKKFPNTLRVLFQMLKYLSGGENNQNIQTG